MKISGFIKDVANSWSSHNISTMSAALAYYTLFSLTPILLISLTFLVFFLQEDMVRNGILHHIRDLFGADTANQIQFMIQKAQKPMVGFRAQLIGWILLIVGSSAIFAEIQSGLNHIWGVRTNPERRWFTIIKNRLLSFLMVLVVAFILLISFMVSIILTAMTTYIDRFFNIAEFEIIIIHSVSFFIIVLLFAMIFKILPDVTIKWKNVWTGAIITTLLLYAGKYMLGIYFSSLQVASMYGAAGSLIVLLIWLYYCAQIFYIGAAITKIISLVKEETIIPKRQAVIVDKSMINPQPKPNEQYPGRTNSDHVEKK